MGRGALEISKGGGESAAQQFGSLPCFDGSAGSSLMRGGPSQSSALAVFGLPCRDCGPASASLYSSSGIGLRFGPRPAG